MKRAPEHLPKSSFNIHKPSSVLHACMDCFNAGTTAGSRGVADPGPDRERQKGIQHIYLVQMW